jgi:hypothetical protein
MKRTVLEGRAIGGESPVAEVRRGCWLVSPSTTGYEEACGNLGGPPSKAKYVYATDSALVP